MSAESGRSEAEPSRRLVEEARELRYRQREALARDAAMEAVRDRNWRQIALALTLLT